MQKIMGRPPKEPGQVKAAYVQLRLTAAERREYDQAAQQAGLSLSAWIRNCLSEATRRNAKRS